MTLLDFAGIYDTFTRAKKMGFDPTMTWDVCAVSNKVADDNGLVLTVDKVLPDLGEYDMVIVPGGFATRKLIHNDDFINWIKTASKCKYKVSVCTGALLVGKAGFLINYKATTHRSATDILGQFCLEVSDDRIVDEGEVITARGVSSSIYLGLHLLEKFYGKTAKEKVQEQIDFCSDY